VRGVYSVSGLALSGLGWSLICNPISMESILPEELIDECEATRVACAADQTKHIPSRLTGSDAERRTAALSLVQNLFDPQLKNLLRNPNVLCRYARNIAWLSL
jgi:hypothetical protein